MDVHQIQELIISEMQKQHISYGNLSAITKIPKSTLQRYATGATAKIPMTAIREIEKALKMRTGQLMGWDSPEDEPRTGTEEKLLTTFQKLSGSGKEKVIDYTELVYNSEQSK